MKRILAASVVLAATVLSGASAFAAPVTYQTVLSGLGEGPPNNSPATGTATSTIDTVANTLQVSTTFSGLLGGTTIVHIHCCTAVPFAGVAGIATQTPFFAGFPIGVTSGAYTSPVFDLTNASTYNSAFVTAQGSVANAEAALAAGLGAGQAYFNIHTTAFPGGEIRGFLVAVPEPGAMSLLLAGLLGAIAVRTRRTSS